MTLACWAVALPLAVWAALRVIGLDRGYPLIALIAFTPHVTGAAVAATVILGLLRRWRPAVLSFAATVVLVVLVAPRAFADGGDEAATGSKRPLRVMSANVA
ncbi:MAG: endonuclease/exonuclease/phosphatase family protein, partial [Actinomycetota bacterium]|nr:endonuclease/exonuclease/phosphatase family protein [Actinomycetota bacterium]